MKNRNEKAFGRQEKVSVFTLRLPEDGERSVGQAAAQAAGRFLQASAQLSAEGFLGIELRPERGAKHELFLFSAPDAAVSDEDYGWMFEDCAEEVPTEAKSLESLFAEGRKVYAFAESAGGEDRAAEEEHHKESGSLYRKYTEERSRADLILQFYKLLMNEGGLLRFVAESPVGRENPACMRGSVLLSLPGEISLRLRSQLALAFPGTVLHALSG